MNQFLHRGDRVLEVSCLLINLPENFATKELNLPSVAHMPLISQHIDLDKDETNSCLGAGQDERHDTAQLTSTKTANVILHQFFDGVLRDECVTPEEMHHASRFIEANLHKLVQDLERFAEQRLLISRNLHRWFVIHEHNSTWETKDPCKKCSGLFDKIEEIYFVACSNVRDMMKVLEKSLRASALFYKNNLEHTPDRAKDQTLGEFCAPLLQHLESTKRMLQSLYDDAEKRKGWPQVSSRAQHSSVASQPADDQDQEKQAESDATKVRANASSSTITSSQINEVFGNTVFPLAHFGRILGCKDGQVSFAINSHGDISAQQWSQSDSQ